jgi:hypothetical protein
MSDMSALAKVCTKLFGAPLRSSIFYTSRAIQRDEALCPAISESEMMSLKLLAAMPSTLMAVRFSNLFKCAEPTTCAMRFSFGRLEPRGWPIRRASFSGKEVGERFLTLVTEHLIPTVGHVATLADLLALLVADMSYCPWLGTNGAIRAAQVVALAGQIGLGAAHIHAMLESRMLLIAHGGSKMSEVRTNPTAYLDRLFEDWAARAN